MPIMNEAARNLNTAIAEHARMEWQAANDTGGGEALCCMSGGGYAVVAGPHAENGNVLTYSVVTAGDAVVVPGATFMLAAHALWKAEELERRDLS
jgi:hypothetical protein